MTQLLIKPTAAVEALWKLHGSRGFESRRIFSPSILAYAPLNRSLKEVKMTVFPNQNRLMFFTTMDNEPRRSLLELSGQLINGKPHQWVSLESSGDRVVAMR